MTDTMTGSENYLEVYEAVGQVTDRMLAAARGGEWDQLTELESECSALVARLTLAARAEAVPLAVDGRARKVEIIQKIMADDRAIRDLVSPWMAELAARLSSASTARKLTTTYAGA
jgi:flagellar protein FliT